MLKANEYLKVEVKQTPTALDCDVKLLRAIDSYK